MKGGVRLCYLIWDDANFIPRYGKIAASTNKKNMNGNDIKNGNEWGQSTAKQQSRPKVKTGVTMRNPDKILGTIAVDKFELYIDVCPELRRRITTFAGSAYGCQMVFLVEELTICLNLPDRADRVKTLNGGEELTEEDYHCRFTYEIAQIIQSTKTLISEPGLQYNTPDSVKTGCSTSRNMSKNVMNGLRKILKLCMEDGSAFRIFWKKYAIW